MDYLSTYHLCPWTQINSHVFVGKPTQLDLKSPEAETMRTKYLTVLTFFVELVKAYSERTIKFKSAISNGHQT